MGSVQRQSFWFFTFFMAVLFAVHPGVSMAQKEPQMDLKTTVQKEVKVKKEGKWVLEAIPVDQTGPGDVLLFTITYLNRGETDAVDAKIINPIPQGVTYIPQSAEGKDADITCSIDDRKSWHNPPVMVTTKNTLGEEVSQPAPAELYTHIRWIIKKPVLPGQSGQVSFRVTVE